MPGTEYAPVVSRRLLDDAQHGFSRRFVTLTGQVVLVPLRRASVRKLLDVYLADRAMNRRPLHWRERVRRWAWIAWAAVRLRWRGN